MPHAMIAESPVELANTAKVMYPASDFAKGDMLSYYRQISPYMIPHLAGRPITVKRYPDGISKGFFYEKHCPAKHPDFIATALVTGAQHRVIRFCMADNQPSLMWLANRAAFEFHTYLFRSTAQDQPTMMVFDLDPGEPSGLKECISVALMLRDALSAIGLQSFVKTSGSKGLHLGIPVQRATFSATKHLAHQLACLRAQRYPALVTDTMSRAHRKGRVFIDWSQNDHGTTTACAYTLRAQAQPIASAPMSWEELARAMKRGRPDDLVLTAVEVLERVKKVGDLFSPTPTIRHSLPRFTPSP